MVKGMLFYSVISVVVVGCHVWVSLVIVDVLLEVELIVVAVGWQVWVSLMVSVGLLKLELGVVVVE
jgi:hypothetical protein